MKIAFIGQKGIPAKSGGVETHVGHLAARLAAAGHEVTVYARSNYADKTLRSWRGVRIVTLPSIPTKHLDAISHTAFATMHALFRRYDVIHYQSIGPSTLAIIPRILLRRTAVISTFHSRDYFHGKWGVVAKAFLRFAERCACRIPHRTIAVSKGMAEYAQKRYGREIPYVPNGAEAIRPESDAFLTGFGLREKRYVLTVSRLVAHKGVHHLIRAFLELEDTGRLPNNFRLAIVGTNAGTPGYERHLRKMSEGRESVLFLGEQTGEALAELFANAAMFVQPSEDEGLSIALLEAMSYRLPIVATNITGNEEALSDAGMYCEPKDVESLKGALARMLSRPDLMKEYGERAGRRASEEYGWDAIARRTMSLYSETLASIGRVETE
ncbi:MAG: glycosyltransferase family 4 protein [Candidatus Moranbacteria bacterium]|nr:glycosyltransferase family 4 protein [Candidatus Moranbacteria bacterium]